VRVSGIERGGSLRTGSASPVQDNKPDCPVRFV
jgi:hypothetical protein